MTRPEPSDRIALFVPDLTGGGAERVMVNVANGLSGRGLSVDLLLAAARGPYLDKVATEVNVVALGSGGVARAVPGLVRYLRNERPRSVLSTLSHANVAIVVATMLAGTGTPLYLREASTPSQVRNKTFDVRSRVAEFFRAATYRRAAGVVAVSQGAARDIEEFLGIPAERIHTIFNPVVDDSIAELAKAPLDDPWLAAGQPPVVLGVGRLGPEKDFATLIRAVAEVRRNRPVRLIILGDGSEREALADLARELGVADDVKLPGFEENPFAYMARAKLFALSSIREGLPGVLIQAMACGTPVVATDCPSGPREILEDGEYGELVPMRDVGAMAEAIDRGLDQEPNGAALVARAGDFSIDKSIDAYRSLLLGAT